MIRFGPAAAPRWFDQRLDRLETYLDHIVAHGAGTVEFVIHGGAPGAETERVHLSQPQWASAVAAAQRRGLEVHLHAPLTPDYRLSRWKTDRAGLTQLSMPIVNLLLDIEMGQVGPPVLVLHAASVPEGELAGGEAVTTEFVTWLVDTLQRSGSDARIAIELRLRTEPSDVRFDRHLSSLINVITALQSPQIGVCWDIANFFAGGQRGDLPTSDELHLINHVHLHDRHPTGRGLHAPLASDGLPWRLAVRHLRTAAWSGAITLEIRYRYALEIGQPWSVLAESLDLVSGQLTEE